MFIATIIPIHRRFHSFQCPIIEKMRFAFAKDPPTAKVGLYKHMRVNFYNSLDITRKYFSEDSCLRDAPAHQTMKDAMEYLLGISCG
jgi:hypothetical protein